MKVQIGRANRVRPVKNISPTRAEALKEGSLYFTGQPCISCGSTTRYTSTWACLACKKKNRKKHRDWAKTAREPGQAGRFKENVDTLKSFYSAAPLGARLCEEEIKKLYAGKKYNKVRYARLKCGP